MKSYIGLGSNLNNPRDQLSQAIRAIEKIPATVIVNSSSVYLTAPVGDVDQPDFYNQVVLVETELTPHELLQALQAIEQAMGRVRTIDWGPRVIDLDVLLCDDLLIESDRLTVPHLHMTTRAFVLYPLAEISSDLVLPSGQCVQSLCQAVSDQVITKCETNNA